MPPWAFAIPFLLLAAHDYRVARRDVDSFRARLVWWRARGAALSAIGALAVYLPGLVLSVSDTRGGRAHGAWDNVGLQLTVVALPLSIGLCIILVSWMGLATYRRYAGSETRSGA